MRLQALACTIPLWFGLTAYADDAAKPFDGTWTAQGDPANNEPTTWVFEEKGDSMKITLLKGKDKLGEFECNTVGRDCPFKDAGKKATVSMWFNGPKLVELETRGTDVIKRRFAITQNGDALDVETIPISQSGKPETIHFARVRDQSGLKAER